MSVLRGDRLEATVQYAARMGIARRTMKKIQVRNPPRTWDFR